MFAFPGGMQQLMLKEQEKDKLAERRKIPQSREQGQSGVEVSGRSQTNSTAQDKEFLTILLESCYSY